MNVQGLHFDTAPDGATHCIEQWQEGTARYFAFFKGVPSMQTTVGFGEYTADGATLRRVEYPWVVARVGGPACGGDFPVYRGSYTSRTWRVWNGEERDYAAFCAAVRRPLLRSLGGGSPTSLPRLSEAPETPTEAQQRWALDYFRTHPAALAWARQNFGTHAEKALFAQLTA